jgi:hypothetical protein
LEEKVAAPGLESRKHCRGDPLRLPRDNLYPQKLTLTPPTSRGCSVGIVRWRTKGKECIFIIILPCNLVTKRKRILACYSENTGFCCMKPYAEVRVASPSGMLGACFLVLNRVITQRTVAVLPPRQPQIPHRPSVSFLHVYL